MILFTLWALLCGCGPKNTVPMKLEKVTDGLNKQVSLIRDESGDILSDDPYQSCIFTPFSGSTGSTRHRPLFYYDQNNRLLYTMTSLGNQNLVQFETDEKKALYQISQNPVPTETTQ